VRSVVESLTSTAIARYSGFWSRMIARIICVKMYVAFTGSPDGDVSTLKGA
jgi:hypothetical protein